jgi:hypothetical protein
MANDDRLKFTSASRATDDAGRSFTEGRIHSDPARRAALREQLNADLLPKLPEIPGFHTCWLSTTNKNDTIRHRVRLGYVPVDPEKDIPAGERDMWKDLKLSSGDMAGLISVNEMIAYKVPTEIYEEIMLINHYERPLEDEEAMKQRDAAMAEELGARGSRLISPDELGEGESGRSDRPLKRPTFAA